MGLDVSDTVRLSKPKWVFPERITDLAFVLVGLLNRFAKRAKSKNICLEPFQALVSFHLSNGFKNALAVFVHKFTTQIFDFTILRFPDLPRHAAEMDAMYYC